MTTERRTAERLREVGWKVAYVRQRLPIPDRHVSKDAYGLGDLLCMCPGRGIALVQCTTLSELQRHIDKATTDCRHDLTDWLLSGGRFWIEAWDQVPRRTPNARTWFVRGREFKLDGDDNLGMETFDV